MVECLTAPLLLHLGEYNLVLDFVGILTDIADCNLVYFIFFLVMSIKAFQSNFSFQVFFTNLFKNYSFHVNSVGFLFYLDSLFSMFKDTFIFLTAQIKKK